MLLRLLALLSFLCINFLASAQSAPPPTVTNEWDSLGHLITRLLNDGSEDLNYYFDATSFWKRIVVRHASNEDLQRINEDIFANPAESFKISTVFAGGGGNVRYKYLRCRPDSTLVIQQRTNEIDVNYFFFKVDYLQKDWKIIDLYMMVYDSYLSSLIRNTVYFPIVADALGRENSRTILANSKIFREAKHWYREGEIERAYLKLSGIPLEERLRDYQVYKIYLASRVEEDAKLLRSMQEYRERFKQEEGLSILLIEYYVTTEDYDSAHQAVARIDSMVGGDSYLLFYKGLLYILEDDWKQSAHYMEQAVLQSPEEEYFLSLLFVNLEEHKAYRWATQILDKMADTDYYTVYDLSAWVRTYYPNIQQSKAFKRWLKKRYRQ